MFPYHCPIFVVGLVLNPIKFVRSTWGGITSKLEKKNIFILFTVVLGSSRVFLVFYMNLRSFCRGVVVVTKVPLYVKVETCH